MDNKNQTQKLIIIVLIVLMIMLLGIFLYKTKGIHMENTKIGNKEAIALLVTIALKLFK